MSLLRASVLAVGILAGASSGAALAQSAAPPAAAPAAEPSTMTKVENWTAKQKATIRRTWAKDKAKWTKCRAAAKSEKWSRKEYWTSQYKCMTS